MHRPPRMPSVLTIQGRLLRKLQRIRSMLLPSGEKRGLVYRIDSVGGLDWLRYWTRSSPRFAFHAARKIVDAYKPPSDIPFWVTLPNGRRFSVKRDEKGAVVLVEEVK